METLQYSRRKRHERKRNDAISKKVRQELSELMPVEGREAELDFLAMWTVR